jgi:hypothetical protein
MQDCATSGLNPRQLEESHVMENIVYDEPVHRGYSVDVGAVIGRLRRRREIRGRRPEVDFVANRVGFCYYVQVAPALGVP